MSEIKNRDDSKFIKDIKEFINVTKEIIEKLNVELDWMKGHKSRCNAAKTVGTTASVIGSGVIIGSLLLAPSTGGTSIVLVTGYGAAVATAGAATNLVTDVSDFFTSKSSANQIKEICDKRKLVSEKLDLHFNEIEELSKRLMKANNEKDVSYLQALQYKIMYNSSSRGKSIVEIISILSVPKNGYNFGLRNGGNFWKAMRLNSEKIKPILGKLGLNISKSTAIGLVKTGTVVLNSIFVVVDVWSYIDNINKDHPIVDSIKTLISNLKKEIKNIEDLLDNIQ